MFHPRVSLPLRVMWVNKWNRLYRYLPWTIRQSRHGHAIGDRHVRIAIRRFVRLDREREFLEKYRSERTSNPDFIRETLTKIVGDDDLPESLFGLMKPLDGCANYLNIAYWHDWRSFVGMCQMAPDGFDKDLEVAPRQRMVTEVIVDDNPVA